MLMIVLGILGLTFIFLPRCRQYQRLQRAKAAVEEENTRLESNIRELETKRKRFTYDKDFVERTARELGMAKPGETIFKFESAAERGKKDGAAE
jgi:cell division protein FtsB